MYFNKIVNLLVTFALYCDGTLKPYLFDLQEMRFGIWRFLNNNKVAKKCQITGSITCHRHFQNRI